MKKIKKILSMTMIVLVLTIMTGCGGNSNPLEGTWRFVEYEINEFEIVWYEHEVTFEDGTITVDGQSAMFEIADDEESLVVSSGMLQGTHRFNLDGNTLYLAGYTLIRYDSNEYTAHREALEESSSAELARLIAAEEERVEEEQRLAEEQLERATTMVTEADEALADLESAIDAVVEDFEAEVLAWLVGEWSGSYEINPTVRTAISRVTISENGEFINHAERIWHRREEDRVEEQREVTGYVEISIWRNISDVNTEDLLRHIDDYEYFNNENHENVINNIRSEITRLENSGELNVIDFLDEITIVNGVGDVITRVRFDSFGGNYFTISVSTGRRRSHNVLHERQ